MTNHVQKLMRLLIIPLYATLVFALKEALAFLPNIEVVTFLLAFGALVFPLYMGLSISFLFGSLEIMLYSSGTWVLLYFTAWPLLVIIIWTLQKIIKKYWWIFVVITSLWGFMFGTFDALLHLIMFGKNTFYVYWIAGIVFDGVHGVSNFMFSALLYKPIMLLWNQQLSHYIINDNNIIDEKITKQANSTLP